VSRARPRPLAALGGGEPAFAEPIVVGKPNLPDRALLHELLDDILDRDRLSNNGPLVQEFEAAVRAITGTRHAVATANGTLGLELAVRALGLTGEVLVPSFTFVATAHCLRWQGIQPRFVDIDPATHLLDPTLLERHITPNTSGILAVHTWGNPCNVDALRSVADAHGLALLFDAAHAFSNAYPTGPVGGGGAAEVFSFHATKFVQAFEGGMITTDSDELADVVASMRNFGFTGVDRVDHLGTNGKMSEISAAMGLASLREMHRATSANAQNLEAYRNGLADVPGLALLPHAVGNVSHQYVVAELDPVASSISRDLLVDVLEAENVFVRRYFHPGVHRLQPYRTEQPDAGETLPQTAAVSARVLVLPTGMAVTPEMVGRVCELVAQAVESGAELTRRLGDRSP
jgi:dTDP-4-amino-4,6-dideoxygalactose transaminase